MNPAPGLPPGRLLAWYGDDWTGAAAVMEALEFGGVPAVLFLDPPDETALAAFPQARGIGIAGTARAEPPEWMDREMPSLLTALRGLGAALSLYKICSTLDSSPRTGSIGRAAEIGLRLFGADWAPLMPASPDLGRWQAFGTLFAADGTGAVHRLDRHPVMARHPVTPMDEAEVCRHLARQTALPLAALHRTAYAAPDGGRAALAALAARGGLVALDCAGADDHAPAGRLLWEMRHEAPLAVGSQGVAYALLAHWRAQGWLAPPPTLHGAEERGPVAAVSGSVSPTTAAQIAAAEAAGFALVPFEAAALLGPDGGAAELARAEAAALAALSRGQSVLVHSARGPDDPAVARFRAALGTRSAAAAQALLGRQMGALLAALVARAGLRRVVVSGGDTAGRAARALGLVALTALAPTVPGAALCRGHRRDGGTVEVALKGGQMGRPDFFAAIRAGGGPQPQGEQGECCSTS